MYGGKLLQALITLIALFVYSEVVASIVYTNSFICTLWSCFKSFHVFFTLYLQTVKSFLLFFKVIAFLHAVKLFQVLFPLIALFAHSEVVSSNVYRNSFILPTVKSFQVLFTLISYFVQRELFLSIFHTNSFICSQWSRFKCFSH